MKINPENNEVTLTEEEVMGILFALSFQDTMMKVRFRLFMGNDELYRKFKVPEKFADLTHNITQALGNHYLGDPMGFAALMRLGSEKATES
jgi:hypothetical protein